MSLIINIGRTPKLHSVIGTTSGQDFVLFCFLPSGLFLEGFFIIILLVTVIKLNHKNSTRKNEL